jgi:hypothetical protein
MHFVRNNVQDILENSEIPRSKLFNILMLNATMVLPAYSFTALETANNLGVISEKEKLKCKETISRAYSKKFKEKLLFPFWALKEIIKLI